MMSSRATESIETIDRRTTRSICDAVGERLQRDLRPEAMHPSSRLEHLMDKLRRQDEEHRQQN
jgi:hypothetical protein